MHLAAEALMHLSTSKPSQPAEEHDSSHPAASPEQDPSLTLGFSFFFPQPIISPLILAALPTQPSFLVTLSVHPSLPFCPSGCHCVTIITYFISLWFHFWWRLARVAFLSLVTFISVRPLLGCGATFFMARMSWAICFPPLQPSPALSRPSETQQEKQPLDLMGSKG